MYFLCDDSAYANYIYELYLFKLWESYCIFTNHDTFATSHDIFSSSITVNILVNPYKSL